MVKPPEPRPAEGRTPRKAVRESLYRISRLPVPRRQRPTVLYLPETIIVRDLATALQVKPFHDLLTHGEQRLRQLKPTD